MNPSTGTRKLPKQRRSLRRSKKLTIHRDMAVNRARLPTNARGLRFGSFSCSPIVAATPEASSCPPSDPSGPGFVIAAAIDAIGGGSPRPPPNVDRGFPPRYGFAKPRKELTTLSPSPRIWGAGWFLIRG
jgi:hypothetical protein